MIERSKSAGKAGFLRAEFPRAGRPNGSLASSIVLLVAAFALSGCFTIHSLGEPESPKVYGGVRRHIRVQEENDPTYDRMGYYYAIFAIDIIPCALLDTLLLPVTPFMTVEDPHQERQTHEEVERRARRRDVKDTYDDEFPDRTF